MTKIIKLHSIYFILSAFFIVSLSSICLADCNDIQAKRDIYSKIGKMYREINRENNNIKKIDKTEHYTEKEYDLCRARSDKAVYYSNIKQYRNVLKKKCVPRNFRPYRIPDKDCRSKYLWWEGPIY